jgi:hypothetical protein
MCVRVCVFVFVDHMPEHTHVMHILHLCNTKHILFNDL